MIRAALASHHPARHHGTRCASPKSSRQVPLVTAVADFSCLRCVPSAGEREPRRISQLESARWRDPSFSRGSSSVSRALERRRGDAARRSVRFRRRRRKTPEVKRRCDKRHAHGPIVGFSKMNKTSKVFKGLS